MNKLLNRKKAIAYLELDEKVFDNYFRNADEFKDTHHRKKHGRFLFSKSELRKWLEGYRWRTVELTIKDYTLCLDFALAQHFRGYVLSDWGTARQREFGQMIANWIKGQLAEIAVKKFFKKNFSVNIEIDFGIYEKIVPQDIIGIIEKSGKRQPRIKIGIKSTKPKSAYLILAENEVVLPERCSDVYILCRPDIPDDHLLRITRERIIEIVNKQQHFSTYKDKIPEFKNIACEIAGWCNIDELKKATEIPGQKFNGLRYVKQTGYLHKNRKNWEKLLRRL